MLAKKNFILILLLLAVMLLAVSFTGCGDDDDDDEITEQDDDDDDDDTVDDDDDDDTTGPVWEGTERVYVYLAGGLVMVNMEGLSMYMWTDPEDGVSKQAMLVQTVVDAAIEKVTSEEVGTDGIKFNFIGADEYNILVNKLFGDFSTLPDYDDLAKGWFIQYEESIGGGDYIDIKVVWDDSLAYEDFMSARMMNGGTVGFVEELYFDGDINVTVDYAAKGAKGSVSLLDMPAFYDGDDLAVYLSLIVNKAALSEFDPKTFDYGFNLIGSGEWNLLVDGLLDDTSLLPVWIDKTLGKDIMHGWIKYTEVDGYHVFFDTDTGFDPMYNVLLMDGGSIMVHDLSID